MMQSLSLEEKIAQLFMIAAYSNRDEKHEEEIEKAIKHDHVGGLIFFQGTPMRQAQLTNRYQEASRIPLWIAMDAEWGLAMRLDSTVRYPRQMMLGSIQNEKLIYDMGCQIAWQLKRLGVHINFAPVADINNNPDNPVINSRSFGEDRANVTRKCLLYMQGLQDNGIIAVAKHFPGHGDTEVDSHSELPVITHGTNRLDSIELFPFKELIYSGLSGVMTGHLHVTCLDSLNNIPSSLSRFIIDTLLRQQMGFKGLVFTDALGMKGISNNYVADSAVLGAFLAGNDIILMPDDLKNGIRTIMEAVGNSLITENEINQRCRKILTAKYWSGLKDSKPVDLNHLTEDLNLPRFEWLQRKLIENSLIIADNKKSLLPLQELDTLRIGAIAIGNAISKDFRQSLQLYTQVDTFLYKDTSPAERDALFRFAGQYNLLIVSLHTDDMRAGRQFGISDSLIRIIDSLCENYTVIIDLFANPYILKRFCRAENASAIVVSHENIRAVQQLSAQLIFGAFPGHGGLPVTLSDKYGAGSGINTRGLGRLRYGLPMDCGIRPEIDNKVDSIIHDAISREAMPGCQVLAAKDGVVFLNRAYGNPSYKDEQSVRTDDLYDIASVTKIVATVPALMKLYEEEKLELDKPLSWYLPFLDHTNKKHITVKNILLHKAGLASWIPYYIQTLEPVFPSQPLYSAALSPAYPYKISTTQYLNKYTRWKNNYFAPDVTEEFPYPVAKGLYACAGIHDSIISAIIVSALDRKPEYKYSDLGFILFYKMIESVSGMPFEDYLRQSFYRQLGMSSMCFNPLNHFPSERIMPTEDDQVFRKQLIRGTVHDPTAALMGGMSGHAGLFSNATDLAKIMQMYLNKGTYAGEKYFNPETIETFTSRQKGESNNRRGLGFDKPETDRSKPGPSCQSASPESFGHTGFTGTLVWADPSCDVIYIFLSNRTYPDAANNKLVELNVRTKIQQEIYNCMER
jgi:beta-glucosidase-like glycosyl hydrolase/CubicO group peptidase (beta-lactamase class C family)